MTQRTDKVKKLADYLESQYDWIVYDNKRECTSCGWHSYIGDHGQKFCKYCGGKLKRKRSAEACLDDLRDALKHAGFK